MRVHHRRVVHPVRDGPGRSPPVHAASTDLTEMFLRSPRRRPGPAPFTPSRRASRHPAESCDYHLLTASPRTSTWPLALSRRWFHNPAAAPGTNCEAPRSGRAGQSGDSTRPTSPAGYRAPVTDARFGAVPSAPTRPAHIHLDVGISPGPIALRAAPDDSVSCPGAPSDLATEPTAPPGSFGCQT